eukprot:COSAG02_NODE_3326_length_6935_cov_9.834552_3_plen_89_part_00
MRCGLLSESLGGHALLLVVVVVVVVLLLLLLLLLWQVADALCSTLGAAAQPWLPGPRDAYSCTYNHTYAAIYYMYIYSSVVLNTSVIS